MTTLKQLIDQLCPDGVEYVRLGDVMFLNPGTRITKREHLGTEFPVYGGGGESFRTDNWNRQDDWVISRFAMSPHCVRLVTGKFWLLDSGITFDTTESASKGYVAHFLTSIEELIYDTSSKSAQRNLKVKEFLNLPIPLPPREVQDKIAEYLDAFAALWGNLDIEIAQREQQFAAYRERMLSEKYLKVRYCPNGVEYVRLGNVAEIARGAKQPQMMGNERITLYSLPSFDSGVPEKILPSEIKSSKIPVTKPSLLVPKLNPRIPRIWLLETPDERSYCSPEFFPLQTSTDKISLKYLNYLILGAISSLSETVSGGSNSHKRLKREQYLNLIIPLPPRGVQDELVEKLDAMQAVIDNLRLEREQRQQQFDYYRERLLTFSTKHTTEV